MRKAMSMAVNSIWVDPESKKNLALLKKDGAFLQQPGAEPATRSLDEANEEKSEDLEAFEGLKGKARIAQEKSEAEEELVETEATKAADEKVLKSTTEECEMAAAAWAKRQSEAKAEQAAIDKAK